MEDYEGMSGQEAEKYTDLLKEAYPQPKEGMRDVVMDLIAKEKAARRRKTKLFVRWGSIAACIVILCGVAAAAAPRLLPNMNKFAVSEKKANFVMQDMQGTESFALSPSDEGDDGCSDRATPEADCEGILYTACAYNIITNSWQRDYGAISNTGGMLFGATYDESVPESDEDSLSVNSINFGSSGDCEAENGSGGSAPADKSDSMETMFENDLYCPVIAEADFDIDGDSVIEHCSLVYGPTSGLSTVLFKVTQGDETEYSSVFILDWNSLAFEEKDGSVFLAHDGHCHTVSVDDGRIVLSAEESAEYQCEPTYCGEE